MTYFSMAHKIRVTMDRLQTPGLKTNAVLLPRCLRPFILFYKMLISSFALLAYYYKCENIYYYYLISWHIQQFEKIINYC